VHPATQTLLVQAFPFGQVMQVNPPVPQADGSVPLTQTPMLQQPLAQVDGLQPPPPVHCPLVQDWPVAQDTHPLPFAPHADVVLPSSQVVPLQQPLVQLVQALLTQWPLVQL
jgi:hypothetical protein